MKIVFATVLLKIVSDTVAVLADSYLTFHASHHFGSGEESVSQQTPSPDVSMRIMVIGR